MPDLHIRPARNDDEPRLQTIRAAAFAPVFASFRSMLGDEIYELSQKRDDEGHSAFLTSLLKADSGWEMYVAEQGNEIVGFMGVRLDAERHLGEIGLNAVDPSQAGKGIGTAMYEFAIARMKDAGMKVATVGTGGDPSHAAARRAYEKAGFAVFIPTLWMSRKL
jgi:ribosomal protein S18 acetylase RimI-like enzyme